MTDYLLVLAAALTFGVGACSAADTSTATDTTMAAGATAADTGAKKPAAAASPHYVQAPTGSSLTFTFDQEGAASTGSFKKFTTELRYDENSPAAGSLDVKIEMASVDTQDKDRDDTLKSADLFDVQKSPTARYVASSLAKNADGMVAVGKLTLRGVTRDLRLPLKIVRTATGLTLSGEVVIKRLDYGVGQGEWQATGSVGDEVKIQYKVSLAGVQ